MDIQLMLILLILIGFVTSDSAVFITII